jgi:apolipoprotein N-acyltransferase
VIDLRLEPWMPKPVAAPPPPSPIRLRTLVILASTTALLLWLAFAAGRYFSGLVFVALVPLMLLVRLPAKLRSLYAASYIGGLLFFLLGLYWLGYAPPHWAQSVLMVASLAGYCALYFPAFLFGARILNRTWNVPALFAFPIVWTALEWVRSTVITGFGWLLLGHSLAEWTWTIQLADFAGAYAVSFLIVLVNSLFVELLIHPLMLGTKFDPTKRLRWRILVVFFACIGTGVYGAMRVSETDRIAKPGPRVVLLHSTLPQDVKDNDVERSNKHMLALADRYRDEKADLLVFPETSLALTLYGEVATEVSEVELAKLYIRRDARGGSKEDFPETAAYGRYLQSLMGDSRRELLRLADDLGKPVVVSLIRRAFTQGRYAKYNSTVLTAPGKGEVGVYDKLHLVPFGEYLPLADSAPFLRWLMPYGPNDNFGLDHASAVKTIQHGSLRFGALICFEDTVPWIARAMVNLPGEPIDFFVNQSNDGWFEGSVEADYHLKSAVFRCVETRKSMVRSTNIGATCLVDSCGRVSGVHPRFEDGASVVDVPLDGRTTIYAALGDWLAIGCGLLTAGYLAATTVVVFRRTRSRLGGAAKS